MAKTQSTGVRLDPSLRVYLERKAEEDRRSLSSLIHKILDEWRMVAESNRVKTALAKENDDGE